MMRSATVKKIVTLVFTLLTGTLTFLLAPIALVFRPQTLKNRVLRTVLHYGKKIASLRLLQGGF
jgi:hypothetical protein